MAPDGGAGCQYAMEHVTAANPFLSAYSRVSWRWEITNYLGVKLTLQWPIRDLHDNRPKDKILGVLLDAWKLESELASISME